MPQTTRAGPRTTSVTAQEALDFHALGRPGKLEIIPTKPMATQRDLSLAYSPGVAVPVKAIAADPARAYDYTTRGNMVAVISNGTAILGLGNLGALASKPVMEGKSVLFKRFADVDSIDLEVDTEDVDEFINCVRFLGPSFGGINLEDIKAPDCFIIEQKLREIMDIPVFHDDQHGTAIIAAAGLINALELTGRDLKTTKLVCNGAGAAAIACVELDQGDGLCARKHHPVRHEGRDLSGPHRRHEPVEVGACGQDRRAHAGRGAWRAPMWCSAYRPRARCRRTMIRSMAHEPDHLRHGQSRSGNHAGGGRRASATTPSWRPAAPTIRTRSTTCSAFPISSAARSTCGPRPSTTT